MDVKIKSATNGYVVTFRYPESEEPLTAVYTDLIDIFHWMIDTLGDTQAEYGGSFSKREPSGLFIARIPGWDVTDKRHLETEDVQMLLEMAESLKRRRNNVD